MPAAQLHRSTAVYVIHHVRKACRILNRTAHSDEGRLSQLQAQLYDDVLRPIYRAYPRLTDDPLVNDSHGSEGAHATRKDIGRATAVRLEAALSKAQTEIGQSTADKADQATDKDRAEAALRPYLDASAELGFASAVVFSAYPDLLANKLRSAPIRARTADGDASFRKMSPPRGSVRLSTAVLDQVKTFMRQVKNASPLGDWIASISWETDRKHKGPNDADWINEGNGFGVGAFSRTEVPPDVIDKVDGIEIVFGAPDPSMLAGKTIDLLKGQLVTRP